MSHQAPAEHRATRRRRLAITLTVTGIVVIALIAVGIYGLITGPRTPPASPPTPSAPGSTTNPPPSPGEKPGDEVLARLPETNAPEEYVRAVSEALFTWDTFTLRTPADHRAVLIDDADPTGEETPGLIGDLDNYFPSATVWVQLQEYRTRQYLEITNVTIPKAWDEARAAAGAGIADGTYAFTVDGVRHREGVWYDKPAQSEHPVAFTVFISCAPAFERCQLLRLSELDNPLR